MKTKSYSIKLDFIEINIQVSVLGGDYLISFEGGKSHLGAVCVYSPDLSINVQTQENESNDKKFFAKETATFCLEDHRDDVICEILAKKAGEHFNSVCICAGGIHIDNILKEQIDAIITAVNEFEF